MAQPGGTRRVRHELEPQPREGEGEACRHTFLKASYTNGEREGNGLFSPMALPRPNLRGGEEATLN
jgi:hypothetical protein